MFLLNTWELIAFTLGIERTNGYVATKRKVKILIPNTSPQLWSCFDGEFGAYSHGKQAAIPKKRNLCNPKSTNIH